MENIRPVSDLRKMQYDNYVYFALREAEKEAALPENWISDEDMRDRVKKKLAGF